MKIMKSLIATAFAVALLASPALAGEKSCCEKAKAEGKECSHKCCIEAKKEGKVCAKCNPKSDSGEKKEEAKS